LSLLQGTNLVEEVSEPINEGMVRYSYKLTERGENMVKTISSSAGRKFLSKMKRDIEEIQKIRTPELIALAKKTGFAEVKETPEPLMDLGIS